MKREIIAVALMMLSFPGLAANWVFVAKDADGTNYYIDKNSIRREGRLVKGWFMNDFVNEKNEYGVSYKSLKYEMYSNCSTGGMAQKQQIGYADNFGNGADVLYRSSPPIPFRFDDPVPGSIGDLQQKALCAKSR